MSTSDTGDNDRKDDVKGSNLKGIILDALQHFPLGVSEYDLIKFLQSAGHIQFERIALWDTLSLFQTHFILFHSLYTLREELWQQQRKVLEISPLKIVLYSYDEQKATQESSMAEHDPLRDYYLDLSNLKQTSADDVARLLDSFWTKLGANDQRAAALEVLELEDPVDYPTIKQQYRRLAMQHHPDRGGDTVQLQTLNYAMAVLDKCYKN